MAGILFWGHTFFEKSPEILWFCHFIALGIFLEKTKLHPWKFYKVVLQPLKTPKSKNKTHDYIIFFVITPPGNSTSLFWNLRISAWSFFSTPGNSIMAVQITWIWKWNQNILQKLTFKTIQLSWEQKMIKGYCQKH